MVLCHVCKFLFVTDFLVEWNFDGTLADSTGNHSLVVEHKYPWSSEEFIWDYKLDRRVLLLDSVNDNVARFFSHAEFSLRTNSFRRQPSTTIFTPIRISFTCFSPYRISSPFYFDFEFNRITDHESWSDRISKMFEFHFFFC